MTALELVEKPDTGDSWSHVENHWGAPIPRQGETLSWDGRHYHVEDVQHRPQLQRVVVHLSEIDAEEVGV